MDDEGGDESGSARVDQEAGLRQAGSDFGPEHHQNGDGRHEEAEKNESGEAVGAKDIAPITLLVFTADAATRESLALQFGPAN